MVQVVHGPPVVLPGGFFTDLREDDTDMNDLETINVCVVSVFSIDPYDGGQLRVVHTGSRGGPMLQVDDSCDST